jgi:hypothetical protein
VLLRDGVGRIENRPIEKPSVHSGLAHFVFKN